MSVLVVGLSHRGASLDLLERFSFGADELPEALHEARASEHIYEVVILSTCNRVEVYASGDGTHAAGAAVRRFLARSRGATEDEVRASTETLEGDAAIRHLFAVASGIDSMVVGEPQILAQVRAAIHQAEQEHAAGVVVSSLFRHAVRVGRRARAQTAIASVSNSFARAAASMATRFLGGARERTALVLGAGKMSDLAVRALRDAGATVLVANRSIGRAHVLAERTGARVVPFDERVSALADADVVIASTRSREPVVHARDVAEVMRDRRDRPMLVLDLAVPRDVEAEAREVPGVVLRDLSDLRDAVAPDRDQAMEIERVREIVDDELSRYAQTQRAQAQRPLIGALQGHADEIRRAELARASRRLGELPARERDAVEALSKAIVTKLLHEPVTAIRRHAGTSQGDALARALRMLYELPGEGD